MTDAASPSGSTRDVTDEDADIVVREATEKWESVVKRLGVLRNDIAKRTLEDDDGFFG